MTLGRAQPLQRTAKRYSRLTTGLDGGHARLGNCTSSGSRLSSDLASLPLLRMPQARPPARPSQPCPLERLCTAARPEPSQADTEQWKAEADTEQWEAEADAAGAVASRQQSSGKPKPIQSSGKLRPTQQEQLQAGAAERLQADTAERLQADTEQWEAEADTEQL
ncbi:hypothetical protein PMIN06_002100 [Paraphaeosphaeria minitans]